MRILTSASLLLFHPISKDATIPISCNSLATRRLFSSVFSRLPLRTNILITGKDEDLAELKAEWEEFEVRMFLSRFISMLIILH